jgi:hypothetical protein
LATVVHLLSDAVLQPGQPGTLLAVEARDELQHLQLARIQKPLLRLADRGPQ